MNEIKLDTRQHGASVAIVFTNILVVIVLCAIAFGMYVNYNLDKAVAEALALGEAKKTLIEEYFETHGKMPQSGAEAGLDRFTPASALDELVWLPGAMGESGSDVLLTGTLHGIVDLSEFGRRFEEPKSAYLLIARAQEDGAILWDCKANDFTKDALSGSYLPESCKKTSDSDDE